MLDCYAGGSSFVTLVDFAPTVKIREIYMKQNKRSLQNSATARFVAAIVIFTTIFFTLNATASAASIFDSVSSIFGWHQHGGNDRVTADLNDIDRRLHGSRIAVMKFSPAFMPSYITPGAT